MISPPSPAVYYASKIQALCDENTITAAHDCGYTRVTFSESARIKDRQLTGLFAFYLPGEENPLIRHTCNVVVVITTQYWLNGKELPQGRKYLTLAPVDVRRKIRKFGAHEGEVVALDHLINVLFHKQGKVSSAAPPSPLMTSDYVPKRNQIHWTDVSNRAGEDAAGQAARLYAQRAPPNIGLATDRDLGLATYL
ncbi:MAG TPA: hypothetical protein VJJ82_03485 [Candidatus Nanoarchaeia archaeon]|nr:hypothetical protein [Candidatus Nanoarchaeia archaeon]